MTSSNFDFKDIQRAYELYKSFEKNRDEVYGTSGPKGKAGSGVVTDLFFINTGHGLEFVKKYSIRGQWERFTNWVQVKLGGENRFSLENNLEEIGKLFEKFSESLSTASRQELDHIAKGLHIEDKKVLSKGEVLREALMELGLHLRQLKLRASQAIVSPERLERLQKIAIPQISLRVESAFSEYQANEQVRARREEIGKLVDAIASLTPSEREVVSRVVPDSLVSRIKEDKLPGLLFSLRKALSRSSEKDKVVIRELLTKLSPPKKEVQRPALLTIAQESFDVEKLRILKAPPLLDKAISIEKADRTSVVEAMEGDRCLIFGGYVDRPMVYELERKSKDDKEDQRWTLRIFTQEGDCLEFAEIKRNHLLGKSGQEGGAILKVLKEMARQTKEKAISSLLSALKPQDEAKARKLLQPGPFGMMAASSLQGALSFAITNPAEKTSVLLENGVHHVDELLQQCEWLLAEPDDAFAKEYTNNRTFYSAMVQFVPQFAERVARWGTLSDTQRKLIDDKIALCEDLLDQLKTKLMQAEKTLYSTSIKELGKETRPFPIPEANGEPAPREVEAREAESFMPTLLPAQERACLEQIAKIPPGDDPAFSQEVKKCLDLLLEAPNFYACDLFFKKLESFAAWDKVDLDLLEPLQKLSRQLANAINFKEHEGSRAERYGMVLFACAGIDRLFHRWAEGAKFPCEEFASPLASFEVYSQVGELKTHDPFWAHCFAEIRTLREKLKPDEKLVFDVPLYEQKREVTLSDEVVRSILKWVASSETIKESIKVDRDKQREEIRVRKEEKQKKLEGLEEERTKKQAEQDSLIAKSEELGKEIKDLEKRISKIGEPAETIAKAIIDKLPQKVFVKHPKSSKVIGEIKDKIAAKIQADVLTPEREVRTNVIANSIAATLRGYCNTGALRDAGVRQQEISRLNEQLFVPIIEGKCEEIKNKKALEKKLETKKAEEKKIKEVDLPKVEKELQKIQGKIKSCQEKIDFKIRKDVRAKSEYWPWGIDKGDAAKNAGEKSLEPWEVTPWDDKKVAAFYFGKGAKIEPLPDEFRKSYVSMALLSQNIFHKSAGTISEVAITLKEGEKLERSAAPSFTKDIVRPDPHLEALQRQNSPYAKVYQHLLGKNRYIPELEIPHRVAIGLDVEPQAPKPPGFLAKIAGWLKGMMPSSGIEMNDEIRELCQLHAAKEIQIDSVLAYFEENSKKLFDYDGRILFHSLLFESNLLQQALKDPQAKEILIPRLRSLFHDTITSASQLGEVESAADILWLASCVQKEIDFLALDESVITKAAVSKMIADFAHLRHQEKWPLVYTALLAACGNLMKRGEEGLVVYAAFARLIQKRFQMPQDVKKAFEKKAFIPRSRDAFAAEKMIQVLLPTVNEGTVSTCAQKVFGTMYEALKNAEFKGKGQGVYATHPDGKTTLSLTDGKLVSTDAKVFQQYSEPVEGMAKELLADLYSEDAISSLLSYKDEEIVSIFDSVNNLYLKVDEEKGALFIKIGELPWCHHLSGSQKLSFANRALSENLHQFYDDKTKAVYFCDKKTFLPLYRSEGGKTVKIPGELSLATPKQETLFETFEDPAHTLYWSDDKNELQLVEFPRLGISLKKDAAGCFAMKEWQLADEQFIPHLEQKNGFIVLEHAKTKEKKALFPVWQLERQKEGTTVQYTFDPEVAKGRYLEFSIKGDELVSKTVEGELYLAKIYLEKGDIDEAERRIFARSLEVTSRKLTDDEIVQLKSIIEGVRVDARILRLCMHALYLLEKNKEQFPKEVLKEEGRGEAALPSLDEIRSQVELVSEYLDMAKDVRPIPSHEELVVMKQLISKIEKQIEVESSDHNREKAGISDEKRGRIQKRLIELEETVQPEKLEREVSVSVNVLSELSVFNEIGDRGGVIRHLRRQFFDEKKKAAEIEVPNIFPKDSPELVQGDQFGENKFDEMKRELQVAKEKSSGVTSYALKSGKELELLETELTKQLEDERKLLSHEESLILNAVASAMRADPKTAFELDTKIKRYPTIQELCVLCARKNYQEFAKKYYPELGTVGIDTLQEAVKKYLFQKETTQQLVRSIGTLRELKNEKDPKLKIMLENKLAETLGAMRAYPPDHPLAMIFLFLEAQADIKLRPDQVTNILRYAAGISDPKEKAKVLQMIMGAGKTSVIQPILAILFARPDTLSTIMVPEAQFQAVRDKLVEILGNSFDISVFSLPYDLELSKDVRFLDTFLESLEEAKKREGCLLIAPRIKHSILTSLREAYYNSTHPESKDHPGASERVEKIAKICKFMEENEVIQIDEIDMIMNPNILFKRPIGEPEHYDKERSLIVAELVLDLAQDKKFYEAVSIDFVNVMQAKVDEEEKKRGAEITEKLYQAKVKPLLVDKACRLLSEKSERLKQLVGNDYLRHFLSQDVPDGVDAAKYREEMNIWIQENVTDAQDRKLLAACVSAVSTILPNSLLKACDSHYGKDLRLDASDSSKRQYIARPYQAPFAPKPTSYSNPLEKVIYSTQYYIKNGIPFADAKEMLLKWNQQATNQSRRETKPIEGTDRFIQLRDVMQKHGLAGFNFRVNEKSPEFDAVVLAFQKAISKDKEVLLEFFNEKLFGQVTVYTKSVTSTPQNLAESPKEAHGYTGTLDPVILAVAMEAIAEIGTDGQTILAVDTKIINGRGEVVRCSDSQGKLPDQVIEKFKAGVSVFLDSGSWLKDEKIEEFALRALEESRKSGRDLEGIVFHNADGKIVCLELGQKEPIPFELSRLKHTPEKRLTIIAQKYETGTDISQAPNAKAFLSIRKGMTLRDALQSIFRMRQILMEQTVSIGISDEVANDICNSLVEGLMSHKSFAALLERGTPISQEELPHDFLYPALDAYNKFLQDNPQSRLNDRVVHFVSSLAKVFTPDSKGIWRYLTVNQANVQEQNSATSAEQRMRASIEKVIDSLLTDTSIPAEERNALFTLFEELYVETELDDDFEKLTKIPDPAEMTGLEKTMNDLLALMERDAVKKSPLYPQISQIIQEKYGELALRLELCCKDVSKKATGAKGGGEIEAEEEVEQEEEALEEAEAEREEEAEEEREEAVKKVAIPQPDRYEPLVDVQEGYVEALAESLLHNKQPRFVNILPGDLKTLPAVDEIYYSPNLFKATLGSELQESKHIAARYLLVCKEGNKSVHMLISHEDYNQIKKQGFKEGKREAVVYTLDGKVAAKPKGVEAAMTPGLQRVLVASKLCTAKSNFSTKEVALLMQMIDGKGELGTSCRDYFEGRLEHLKQASRDYYSGDSDLQKKLSTFPTRRIRDDETEEELIPI